MSSLRTWLRGSGAAKSSAPATPAVPNSPSAASVLTLETPAPANATPPPDPTGAADASDKAATAAPDKKSSKKERERAREQADMQDAMLLTARILNDDIDGAEAELQQRIGAAGKDASVFHVMGLGVATFMRAVLGFEKDTMADATARLGDVEARAWDAMRRAQQQASGSASGWFGGASADSESASSPKSIYPAGSEYALVHAEAQLMLAVVGQLHESLTEAVKGFYKLRKAYVTLHAIATAEDEHVQGASAPRAGAAAPGVLGSMKRLSFSDDPMPGAFDDAEFADLEAEAAAEAEAAKADLARLKAGTGSATELARTTETTEIDTNDSNDASSDQPAQPALSTREETHDQHVLDTLTNPMDVFIHSGANMGFGLLLLLISMVPPAFSRLLSIVGFRGDRERGVRMLWQSTKFANINGGMAGLVLLAYYNGLMAYSDILPDDDDIATLAAPGEVVGYPRARCAALLAQMRRLFPDSQLWVLEEARLLATEQRVTEAMAMIRGLSERAPAKMRQITALLKFELGLDAMSAMAWPEMRDAFLACIELNSWSHAMYYYNAGSATLELYRDAVADVRACTANNDTDGAAEAQARADKHKAAATTYLRKAPGVAGKKKFMARQMPLDVFVARKLDKWEARAAALGVDLVDAIGTGPALEMAFLWNGSKRLSAAQRTDALALLDWGRCTASAEHVAAIRAAPDEDGVMNLCRAGLLRSLGRLDEAAALLTDIRAHDRAAFKGAARDDYVLPAATYEAAVVAWEEALLAKLVKNDMALYKDKVDACAALLERVRTWEAFVLDARIGMKLQTALDTVRWLRQKRGWSA